MKNHQGEHSFRIYDLQNCRWLDRTHFGEDYITLSTPTNGHVEFEFWENGDPKKYSTSSLTILENTGKMEHNGEDVCDKYIFQGDIIKNTLTNKCYVVRKGEYLHRKQFGIGFFLENPDDIGDSLPFPRNMKNTEILGNIFDCPGLKRYQKEYGVKNE